MDFTSYEAHTVGLVVDLVNSLGSITGTEYLPDVPSVTEFLERHEVTLMGAVTDDDARELRALRERLRAVFHADSGAEAAAILNRLLAESDTQPHLTDHDGTWHFHYTSSDAPLAERLQAICAMALASAIAVGGFDRLGICAATKCQDVYVDTSRNRSRRYCNDTCATRMNVAAYRARSNK